MFDKFYVITNLKSKFIDGNKSANHKYKERYIVIKILFVCMGNICRSPAAEGIFNKLVEIEKLDDSILTDSAGTIGYHSGELPDERMRRHGQTRGYIFDSRARQFNPKKDFDKFDYIITMDNENYSDIIALDSKHIYEDKIIKMADFIFDQKINEVPDPYYSGSEGFEYVLNLLEVGTKNILAKVKEEIEIRNKK